jgi:hypothetical protein
MHLNPDVELSVQDYITITKGQSVNISVQGSWTSCQWYVNGTLAANSGYNYLFNSTGRNAGVYTVTAVVTNSAQEKRSASCRVTLKN